MDRTDAHLCLLDHLRWLAAAAVLVSHVRNMLLIDFDQLAAPGVVARAFYFVSGFGHVAVTVFFVLSGYLVGERAWRLLSARDFDARWNAFVIDRLCRVAVVLWPALLLSAACLYAYTRLAAGAPILSTDGWDTGWHAPLPHDLAPARWIGNALLLNELRVPTIHTDGPLWSLAYEWSYYVIAAAAVALLRKAWRIGTLLVAIYALALIAMSVAEGGALLMAGTSWIIGAAAGIAARHGGMRSRGSFVASAVVALAVVCAARMGHVPDIAIGAAVGLTLAHAQGRTLRFGVDAARRLAAFSFSLYAVHAPIATLAVALAQHRGWLPAQRLDFTAAALAVVIGICAICVAAAYAFSLVTERHTAAARRWLLRRMAINPPPALGTWS